MLTDDQRDAFRDGSIKDKPTMKKRVRKNLINSLSDINIILRNYTWVEGNRPLTDELHDETMLELVTNLLYVLDNELIDEDLIWMLIKEAQETWTVPDVEQVHGRRHELALRVFIECFDGFDPEEPMKPEPSSLENWDEFESVLEDLVPDCSER